MNYQLTLTVKNKDIIKYHELVESNDLVQLVFKLSLLVLRVQQHIHEDELVSRIPDDDIPF